MKRKAAIVLGGTSPHIELICKLQERGYYTILVDYLDNPPARKYADIHIKESTLDKEKVLAIAKEYQVEIVISACVDQANIVACYVNEKLALSCPYSYNLAVHITNKGYMKQVMFEHGIPTSKYIYLDKGAELPEVDLKYPLMVKPADSCAASGVKKAHNQDEMLSYLADAQRMSRNGRAVIEEFVAGDEVSVYSFVSEGSAHIIMISQRMSVIEGEQQVLKCYATLAPAPMSDIAYKKIEVACTQIARAFELDNTPLHVQVLIDGDNINIIEFAPRVGGGISYRTIRANTGFDIIDATIDSYLGKQVKLSYTKPKCYYTVNLIYGTPGVFDRLEGAEKLIEDRIIESIHFHKTRGMAVSEDRASGGRIAAFIVKAKTKMELLDKIKTAMDGMQVYDAEGTPMMRKDLYLKKI